MALAVARPALQQQAAALVPAAARLAASVRLVRLPQLSRGPHLALHPGRLALKPGHLEPLAAAVRA